MYILFERGKYNLGFGTRFINVHSLRIKGMCDYVDKPSSKYPIGRLEIGTITSDRD